MKILSEEKDMKKEISTKEKYVKLQWEGTFNEGNFQ